MSEPTILVIDDTWRLRQGTHDWVLEQQVDRKAKDGPTYSDWDTVGFYGDLGAACCRWMRLRLNGLGPAEISQLLDALEAAEKRVVAVLEAYHARESA